MVALDTLIYAKPAAWEAIAPNEGAPIESWHLSYKDTKSGYWLDFPGGFRIYNVLADVDQITDLVFALQSEDPVSVARVFSWIQEKGTDSLLAYQTTPGDVLAVMKPNITYDGAGNPTGSVPASITAPNWGHVFFGQRPRIFAGAFSKAFSRAFK